MTEIWKVIEDDKVDFKGAYMISNLGRVKSLSRDVSTKTGQVRKTVDKIIAPVDEKIHNRMIIPLYDNAVQYKRTVHILVARAFVPNPKCYKYVEHIDGDYHNNRADNLVWVRHKMRLEKYKWYRCK